MTKIIRFVLADIIQNRIVLAYALFLLASSIGLFQISDEPAKGIISLLNIVLIVVPLVTIVFSTIHFYNSYEFIELLAAQPVKRSAILWGEFLGLAVALSLAVLLGIGLPVCLFSPDKTGFSLLGASLSLTWIFSSLAILTSVCTRDKAKGIGAAILLWFYFSLIYDAIVLFLMFSFSDYPLEKAIVGMVALNPIDLARVSILLQMDISALMGYTGALFREFLGTGKGIAMSVLVMGIWVILPMYFALRIFRKKDL